MRGGAAAAIAALALAGCGGGGGGGNAVGDLVWKGQPRVLRSHDLPRDRVLTGVLENNSLRRLKLKASDLKLVDADGHDVAGSPVFLGSFVRGLFPGNRPEDRQIPEKEKLRIGKLVKLDPGKTVPFTDSWRLESAAKPPVRIVYSGGSSLPIPGAR